MITRIPTRDMSREEWLEARRKSIGGSDAAAILGLNTYRSAYSLWAEKTGKVIPEDISDKESVRLGNDLEDYVAARWEEKTGKKVRRCNMIFYNDQYPFAHANPDRMVTGEAAGLECKTTSNWETIKELRAGKIPDYWYCQCVHYMMVTGCSVWYLCALAFGDGVYDFAIERNEAEIEALASAEKSFWAGVEYNAPPALDGSESTDEALKVIYPDSTPGTSIDLSAVGHHIEMYNSLGKQIKELQAMQDEAANNIKEFMGTCEKGVYGDTTISWKSSSRKTFDKAAYEVANGRIADEYYKTSESRTFRVNVKKEK